MVNDSERLPASAVHAMEAPATQRHRKGRGQAAAAAAAAPVRDWKPRGDDDGGYADEDDDDEEGGATLAHEGDDVEPGELSGSEDCVTFCIVAGVIAAMIGLFGYLFLQMTSPSELLSQRLQSAPRVEAKHLHVHVDLAQFYRGHVVQVDVDRQLVCRQCAGTGFDLREGFHDCHTCKGSGIHTFVQQIGPIKQHVRSACTVCKGRGKVANKNCDACHGHGLLRDRKALAVAVEPGMRHGDTVTLAHEGDQATRALPGDVVVHLLMDPHATFTRRGDDLEMELQISLLEALVGFTREVPHVDHSRVLTLTRAAVVSPATVWRIPREGMPMRGRPGAFGDLLVRFSIAYPPLLTPQEKQRVAELL